jgi:hypothetical protein
MFLWRKIILKEKKNPYSSIVCACFPTDSGNVRKKTNKNTVKG